MDKQVRGALEKSLDGLMGRSYVRIAQSILEGIPTRSKKDICLGYQTGFLESAILSLFLNLEQRTPSIKEQREIRQMIVRRLPEMIKKIIQELG